LRAFLPLGDVGAVVETGRLRWMVAIHLTFVVSGVLLALTDLITSSAKSHETGNESDNAMSSGGNRGRRITTAATTDYHSCHYR
jgi:hypothetical protein